MVTRRELEQALDRLGLRGASAAVHTSLRSLGVVEGGADTVARVLAGVLDTALLPAFSFASNAPPPAGDRPARNGCDYAFYDDWTKAKVPFRVESADIDRSIGALPRRFAALDAVVRSDHPWHSWIARGPAATALL